MKDNANTPWLLQLKDAAAQDASDDRQGTAGNEDPGIDADARHATLPRDTLGIAFSGGGIRSATFCLGVLQALAKKDWLRHIDYLSTVSGGGYTGGFLGRFFDVAQDPRRVRKELSDPQSPPLTWLREHANYLSPQGAGDTVFNIAAFWRNLLSLHFVLVCFAFGAFGIANAIAYYPFSHFDWIVEFVSAFAPLTTQSELAITSPWLALFEAILWVAVLPLGLAYWLASEDYFEDFVLPALFIGLVTSVAILIATLWVTSIVIFIAAVLWVFYTWGRINREEGRGDPASRFRMALARNYLTRLLAFWAQNLFIVAIVWTVDMGGRELASHFMEPETSWISSIGYSAASAILLSIFPVLRFFATYVVSRDEERTDIIASLARIPYLPTVTILAVGGLLPAMIVAFLSHLVFELGQAWVSGVAATGLAIVISLVLGRRRLISFVNRSGTLGIYSARIARVFFGAVNPRRQRHTDGGNVSHVIYGDDTTFANYKPHEHGGPLHLINVAVNETIDVASQRGARDRQAENMAVGPAGINVAKNYHAIWIEGADDTVRPVGDLTEAHPFLSNNRDDVEVEGLNLRQWIGISGAAVSPGLGRQTSNALALLLTLTNLRLGYWWNSGLFTKDRFRVPFSAKLSDQLRRLVHWAYAPQALLVSELAGRFGGPWHRRWYLSDGGHFEMTGAYELLRRRVPFIIAVDAGADKSYEGGVFAWLVRLTRIDFGAEFEATSQEDAIAAGVPEDVATQLGTTQDLVGPEAGIPTKRAVLFKVTFPGASASEAWHGRDQCWLLYLRATALGDEPADVRSYQQVNVDFPNESTLDQFFNEPQWESYRRLGEFIGEKVFT